LRSPHPITTNKYVLYYTTADGFFSVRKSKHRTDSDMLIIYDELVIEESNSLTTSTCKFYLFYQVLNCTQMRPLTLILRLSVGNMRNHKVASSNDTHLILRS